MDPLSALGVAAAVLQFVEFGYKTLRAARSLLLSDSELMQSELATLKERAETFSSMVGQIEESYGYPGESASRDSDKMLASLCAQCKELHGEIQKLVSKVSSEEYKTSLRKVLDAINTGLIDKFRHQPASESPEAKEIAAYNKALAAIREDMMLAVQLSLWSNGKETTALLRAVSLGQEEIKNFLAKTSQVRGPGLQDNDAESSRKSEAAEMSDEQKGQALIDQIWAENHAIGAEKPSPTNGREADLQSIGSLARTILSSLAYSEMRERQEAIPEAYEKTFEWIFKPVEKAEDGAPLTVWSDFTAWLEEDVDHMYWIAGKPGSGKSTLMKYIWESDRLSPFLVRWAGERPLLSAAFYTWSAGSDMQRSEAGLLRHLLHQYLAQMPGLIPRVCPRRWALFKTFGTEARWKAPAWTLDELHDSFGALVALVSRHDYRIAMFIDGLDEFSVEDNHKRLIDFIKKIHTEARAKICVSSRDWVVFVDAFNQEPGLRVQDLTKRDIEHYVRTHCEENLGFQELQQAQGEEIQSLIDSIVTKARGVFLWITIVTRALLNGMSSGDNISELYEELNSLPPDLSDLYQNIWSRLSSKDKPGATHFFLLVDSHDGPIDTATMFIAEQPDPFEACEVPEDVQTRQLTRRLRSRTRGLLEISSNGHVNYLHRTAKDWIRENWKEIFGQASKTFDPNLRIFAAKVALMSKDKFWKETTNWQDIWMAISKCFGYASMVIDQPPNTADLISILDRMDEEISKQAARQFKHLDPSSDHKAVHWSSTQFDFRDGLQNTFVGLAAQYAILPYVKSKVEAKGLFANEIQRDISLLENALFVPGNRPSRLFSFRLETSMGTRFRGREELIGFLLEHGADPDQDASLFEMLIPSKKITDRYRLFDKQSKSTPLSKRIPRLSAETGNNLFWTRVQELMKKHSKGLGASFTRVWQRGR